VVTPVAGILDHLTPKEFNAAVRSSAFQSTFDLFGSLGGHCVSSLEGVRNS
jgi:hypothetical protein